MTNTINVAISCEMLKKNKCIFLIIRMTSRCSCYSKEVLSLKHICGIVAWTNGLSKEFRKRVVDAHQAGKGYQSICEALGCHQSTVRPTVYKWKKFRSAVSSSSSCLPIKINPRARCVIVCKVTEEPGVTPKQLNASLTRSRVRHQGNAEQRDNNGCEGKAAAVKKRALLLICSLLKITRTNQKAARRLFVLWTD